MSIQFENVNLLSLTSSLEKIGNENVKSNKKEILISGLLLDLQNPSGVESIFEEYKRLNSEELSSSSSDYSIINDNQEIFINGVSHGEGSVISFAVSGEFIRDANFTASIEIIEAGSVDEIYFTTNDKNNIKTAQQLGLQNEDLKYLKDFSENFSFSESANSLDIQHSVSCSFEKRESLLENRKNIWSNSSVQDRALENLNGKGNGSIKVSANQKSSFTINLTTGRYSLYFDYLGQDSQTYNDCQVKFQQETLDLKEFTGQHYIEINNVANQDVKIELIASTDNNTFFDNIYLYKTNELPINKSREFASNIFSSSINYPILSNTYQGEYKNVINFNDFGKSESFDHISNKYNSSRNLRIDKLDSNKEYSTRSDVSINVTEEGFIEITEDTLLVNLKDESDNSLKSFTQSFLNSSNSRISSKLNSYSKQFFYQCPSATPGVENQIFEEPLYSSVNYQYGTNSANISLKYTNSPKFQKSGSFKYILDSNVSIEEQDGFELITINGESIGHGSTTAERINNSKKAIENVVNQSASQVSEIATRRSYSNTFKEVEKQVSIDNLTGSFEFSLQFSNQVGYTMPNSDIENVVKKFELTITENESTQQGAAFFVNCSTFLQRLGALQTAKTRTINIQVTGKKGQGLKNIKNAAEAILLSKNLLEGNSPESENIFLAEKIYEFDYQNDVLNYTREIVDLSECVVPTDTVDPDFGFDLSLSLHERTPTSSFTTQLSEEGVAFTPITDGGFKWNFDLELGTPKPTPTLTITDTPSLTQTNTVILETPTYSATQGGTQPTFTYTYTTSRVFHEVYIPENWNDTAAKLFPDGDIYGGKKCWDDGGSVFSSGDPTFLIDPSWAENNVVKDCVKAGSGQAFNYLIFESDAGASPPDLGAQRCDFHTIYIPKFWNLTVADLVQETINNSNFIGGFRNLGQFEYNHKDSNYDHNSKISQNSENNSFHPDLSNTEFFAGPMIFESCSSLNATQSTVLELEIPADGQNLTINQRAENEFGDSSGQGCYDVIGVQSCFLRSEYNDERYHFDDIVKNCIYSLSEHEQINFAYVEYLQSCPTSTETQTT
jgi:hypothetical protein